MQAGRQQTGRSRQSSKQASNCDRLLALPIPARAFRVQGQRQASSKTDRQLTL
jgi:hypothetical protein